MFYEEENLIELDEGLLSNESELDDTIRHELCHWLQSLLFPYSLEHGREFRDLAKLMKCRGTS